MELILSKKAENCHEEKNELTKVATIENEVIQISSKVELMIIIGNRTSDMNLYNIAEKECRNAMFIETIDELYTNYIKRFKKVGVIAGYDASCKLIDEVVKILKNLKTEDYMYENSR